MSTVKEDPIAEILKKIAPGTPIREDHESKTYTIKVIKEAKEVIENEPEPEQEENTDNNKEKAETKMISMPVYLFIIMQIIIIVVEVIVIYFIPWKKIIKK